MTIHTPNAGTGLTGSWHVGNPITVRADLALSEPGSLGGVQWLEDVPDGYWRELADLLWMQTDTGLRRRPSEPVRGCWVRLGHLLVAPLGLRLVVVPAWVAPALYRPDGTRRPCSVVTRADGRSVVVVSDGGDVVAFVPVVGVGAR